jgi:hypothetical protein
VAVTVDQIKQEFPEFANTDPRLIAAKLADATGLLNKDSFGPLWDQAVKYKACHLLALSPSGEYARLKDDEGGGATTVYERHYLKILRGISTPMVV